MLTSPASTHIFSNLDVPDGMHKICHDGFWQEVRDITEYQMQAFARLLEPFNAPDPSGATLLDRGLIYGTSEYGEGWKHSVKELPVVLAGGANGRIARGTCPGPRRKPSQGTINGTAGTWSQLPKLWFQWR